MQLSKEQIYDIVQAAQPLAKVLTQIHGRPVIVNVEMDDEDAPVFLQVSFGELPT